MTNWVLAISYFLHGVATIAWIGGLALMVIVVWPIARLENEQHALLLDSIRKRFTPIANLSLLILLGTGIVQMEVNPHYTGLLQITDDWGRAILLKHLAFIVMIVISAIMQWQVLPALERATLLRKRGKDVPDLARLQRRERQLLTINLILGVIVLFFTAIAVAV